MSHESSSQAAETIRTLTRERDALRSALEAAEKHLEELRDAWERGAIVERDSKGGLRSNTNADVLFKVRASLATGEPEKEKR